MIAAHLGIVREDDINEMSIPFFNDVLGALGRRLNYESISNLYGNSFCKDANKYIQEAYPLTKAKKIGSGLMDMFGKATIIKANAEGSKNTMNALEKDLGGDLSWAEGLL